MAERRLTDGERLALSEAQARGGPDRAVAGIDERTEHLNPDSAPAREPDPAGAGMAGPVGYFEGEGNEGPYAPLGGDPAKDAADGAANAQGGVASGAPDAAERP